MNNFCYIGKIRMQWVDKTDSTELKHREHLGSQAPPEVGKHRRSKCTAIRLYRLKRRGQALEMSAHQAHLPQLQGRTWHYKMLMAQCEQVGAMQQTLRLLCSTSIIIKS